jgi:hypothetical protein
MMTGAITEEDGERSVLHFGVPMSAPEVTAFFKNNCSTPDFRS